MLSPLSVPAHCASFGAGAALPECYVVVLLRKALYGGYLGSEFDSSYELYIVRGAKKGRTIASYNVIAGLA